MEPGDALQGQHPAAGPVPVDRRDVIAFVLGRCSPSAPRRRRPRSGRSISICDPGFEIRDDLHGTQPARFGRTVLGLAREPSEEIEIAAEGRLDSGPQDLDRDLAVDSSSATVAKWTWAIEAAATGVSSKLATAHRPGARALARRSRAASDPGKGGSLSCSPTGLRRPPRRRDRGASRGTGRA